MNLSCKFHSREKQKLNTVLSSILVAKKKVLFVVFVELYIFLALERLEFDLSWLRHPLKSLLLSLFAVVVSFQVSFSIHISNYPTPYYLCVVLYCLVESNVVSFPLLLNHLTVWFVAMSREWRDD